jgi:hypothetical protein
MTEQPHTTDNIRIAIYNAQDAPTFSNTHTADPKYEYQTHNVTRAVYHEAVVGGLNGVSPELTVDALALGDSTLATADVPDSDPLGNETFRTTVTDTSVTGQTFTAATFIDSTEGNTQVFNEAALVSEQASGDLPINRFLIDDSGGLLDPKTAGETVTIDIEIRQEDA